MSVPLHLTPGSAFRLVAALPLSDRPALVHALGCAECGRLVEEVVAGPPRSAWRGVPRIRPVDRRLWAELAPELETTARRLAGERKAAERLVAGLLLATPHAERAARIRKDGRLRTLAVALVLLRGSLAAGAGAPEDAADRALLALTVLERLKPGQASGALVTELQARAWALVAHAFHRQGSWPGMREALESAVTALRRAGYAVQGGRPRALLAAVRDAEQRLEAVRPADEAAVGFLLRALLGEAPVPPAGDTP